MRLDIYVNYRGTCEEAFRFYERLLGGEILKMEKTFFANRFAMVRDRFGTSWMLLQGSTAR
jgi:PhnB protein